MDGTDEWDEYLNDESPRTRRVGKQKGKAPRSNERQNEQTDSIANELGLSKKKRRQLHDEISGQGYSYQEIHDLAEELFGER